MKSGQKRFIHLMLLALCICSMSPLKVNADKETPKAGNKQVTTIGQMHTEALGLFSKGNLQDAIALWKRADELAVKSSQVNSVHPDILGYLGMAFYRSGSLYYPLVHQYIDRLIEMDPNRWDAYLILGNICYETYKPDCAIGYYDLFLHLNPKYKQADQLRQKVGALRGMNAVLSERENTVGISREKLALSVEVEIDMPKFIFYISTNDESYLTRIDIVRENESTIHQTIKYEVGDVAYTAPADFPGLIDAVDFNGDGYNDVKIACASGDDGEIKYLYYLYHKINSLFIPFVGGALPDQARGQGDEEVRVYKKSENGRRTAVDGIYKFSAGRLVPMKRAGKDAVSP